MGCIDWPYIGVVSHHLRSLSGVIQLTGLRVFVRGVEHFDVQIKERHYCTSRRFDLLSSFEKHVTNHSKGIKPTKQLAFLLISSSPSLKIIAHKFQATRSHRITTLFSRVIVRLPYGDGGVLDKSS